MATLSSILAWRIPRTEETGGLQSMGSQRVRQDWSEWAQHTAGLYWKKNPHINGPVQFKLTLFKGKVYINVIWSSVLFCCLSRMVLRRFEHHISAPAFSVLPQAIHLQLLLLLLTCLGSRPPANPITPSWACPPVSPRLRTLWPML